MGTSEAVVFHDGASNAQRMLEFVWHQANEVKKYAQMLEDARMWTEQLRNMYTMIEQNAKHLTEMPKGSNILDWLSVTNQRTIGILSRVQRIGFDLDRTSAQFEKLYRDTTMLMTPEGREQRLREMQAARLEMVGVSMQAQSIKDTFVSIYTRLTTLLGASSWAEGTRALQQIQAQQRALAQQQAELGITMQAVNFRLQSMKDAEEIVRQRMDDAAAQYNAQRFMEGFHSIPVRSIGEGQGFYLPR